MSLRFGAIRRARLPQAVIVTNLSGALVRVRPPFFGGAMPADFFAAYEAAYGRPFPPDLLPQGPLRVLGDCRGRHFAREEAPSLGKSELPPRRTDRIQLLIGKARGPKYWHGKFSLRDFVRDCPPGFFLAGFDRRWMGLLRFYYMRRDEWSRVLFRLPCRGASAHESKSAMAVPDFLDAFAAFSRAVRPHVRALVACEKSNNLVGSLYEITMADGSTRCCDETQFYDGDFSALAERLLAGRMSPT
jgi:hypothetical protein